ncbi:MAG: DUF5050 domain-containing protein, partial [Nostocales cyanobacterium LacPavin_0920_SED1_MAG_38_18]|nr:DUF5050 domain-containing protein [Nostocales cyanobacterium LacPavin_0920_SED1_MAG_38_18]
MTSTPAMNEPYLVSDINATTYSSNPSSFINVGGILYFTADNDTNGLELYKADISTGVVSLIEINAGSGSSSPTYLTDVNGTLYFQAYDPTNGYELWKIGTNGTPTRIDLGSDSSSPANLTNVNGTLYFVAYTPTNGYELWKIDPTTGTPSVIDIVSGSGSSFPTNLTNANGTLYFRASTSATGYELWKIDSTTGSPVFLKDIQVGNGSSNPGNLTYSNGKIYFTADNFTQGVELWQTDGTPEGTVLTQDINATTYSSNPSSFINVGGILYFTANNDINGIELYKADTSTGVVSLIEINAGSGSSSPTYLTDVNGTLYFQANDPTNGSELWKIGTNGTLTRIDLGTGGSSPNNLTNVNGTLYFTAYGYNGVNYLGYELWKIDPTTGTPSVIDIVSGSGTSSPSNLININGVLYFTASTSATGSELWKLDPANNLPVLISDLYPGANSSNPSNFINSGGTVYFIANNSTNGHELFRIDPTTGNPVLLDIYAGANSSSPNGLIDINGTLYFKADDGVNGNQLWKIDPTTGNPVRLVVPDLYDNNAAYLDSFTNVGGKLYFRSSYYNSNTTIYQPLYTIDSTTGNPVAVAGVSYVSNLTNINGVLYFQGYTATNGFELWKIDSTTGQPVVIDIVSGGGSSSPTNLTNVNGTLFFAAYNVANGQELWKIDSTGNPVLVKDINPGSGYSSPSSLFNVNGTLYFTANDGTNGVELWKSDGTTAGTVIAKDINGRTYSSDPNSLIDVNGTLYFKADDGVNGNQLWKIDPTTGNPVRLVVPDLYSNNAAYIDSFTNVGGKLYFRSSYYSNSTYQPLYTIDSTTGNPVTVAGVSYVSSLININGVLYFQAYTATNGFELWKIDSTTGKPVVIDIVSGSGSSSPTNLTNVNGTLFFVASNAANGQELWKLDSTGNPVLVKDIYPGSNGSSPSSLFNVNGTLYFTANDGTNGVELWKSDGTAAGTVQLEIYPGANSPNISNFLNVGGVLYFTANNATNGQELWRINSTTGNPEVIDIVSGTGSSSPSNLTNVNGTLYFQAYTPTNGYELWKIDSTTGKPVVIDIISGSGSSSPTNLTNVNGTLYFQAYTPTNGYELWKIDTTTGTPSVIDVVSGTGSSSPTNLTNVNGTLYFTASTSANGYELWKIDATTGSPVLLKDIQVGGGSSNPGNLTYSNGKLYFTADNFTQGVELWAVDINTVTTVGSVAKTGNEDQTITFSATDFSSIFSSSSGISLATIKIVQLPSNGVLKLATNNVTVNQEIAVADLGSLTFVPNANFNGTAGFTWNGSDGTNYAANPSNVIFTINSVNDVPEIVNPIPDINFYSNTFSNFNISENAFRDADLGDSLTYSATLADGSPLPSWLTLNNKIFSGTPPISSTGKLEIKVTATDPNNASVADNFILTVINSAPTSIYLSKNTIPENSANNTVIGNLISVDANANDTHTYTLINDAGGRFALNGNQIVVANGGLLDYETATGHIIRVKTTDSTGLSYEGDISISISNVNDAFTGSFSFTAATYNINERGTAIISLTRTGGSDGEVSVTVTATDGIATAGSDYNNSNLPVTLTFANGEINKSFTIPIIDDNVYEPTETVNLALSNPTNGATLGTQKTAILNIIDNDAVSGVIQFSNANYSINEDGTPVTAVTLTRTNGSEGEVSATISLTNGTATLGSDYSNNSIPVTFANGETSKTVTIPIFNDSQFEPDETINLTLTNTQGGATLGTQTTATLTIINDDLVRPGTISLNSSTYNVNENGTASINLIRTGGIDGEVSVTLTPNDGTATAGSDYNNSPITVTFANGETSKDVIIPIIDDNAYEPTETVNLALSNPTNGATLGTQKTAVLNIIDNDAVPGVIQFSNANYSVNEDGTPVTAVTLTRTNSSEGEVSATVYLTNGTATAGSDYSNSPITVTFANRETTKTVTIPIIDDSLLESNETINLSLSNPTNGVTLGTQNSAVVNIIDNDFKPILTVNITAEQATEGNTIQGTVTRNTATTEPLTVTLVNSDNSQITVPTTVTIPAGANSATFNITAVDDTLIELPKNYTIIASAAGFISGSDSLAIIDNDGVNLTLTLDTNNINENGGKAIATITRNIVTDTPLLVQLSSSDTTEATVPATVIIAANQASATFEIQGVDDTILDSTQAVMITAKPTYTDTSVVTNAGQATANLNVVDNESSSLNLVIDKDIIAETGTATATITRNTDINSELIVNLSSSDTTEATVPNTVTIPVGQNSATFTITGVSDGINDGSQKVTITASATGLNSGSDNLEVTDINVPDLMVTQLQGIQTTYTGKQSQFTYTVTNNGIISAAGSWKDRVYLSTDNKLDTNDTLLGEFGLGSTENPANLLAGTSYNRTVTYFAPRTPGQYYLIGVTDSGNTVNEGVSIGENNNTTITPVTITPAYRGTVYTDTETGLVGNPVTFRGTALSNSDNSPVPYEFVKVRVENNDIIREFDTFTDANGNFTQQFTPLQGEAGTYKINAYFPGNSSEDSAAEDQFKLLGMRFEDNDKLLTQVSQKITEGTTFNGAVKLQNLSDVGLSGLTATINGAPSDWIVNVTPEKTSLAGNEEITVNYSINVPDSKWQYDNFSLGLTTTEGVTATLPVTVNVEQILPRLVADTSNLEASMLRGGQKLVEFTVTNQGGIASGNLDILLPEASWLKLASPVSIPSLNPGESTKVSVLLQPSATQELTVYNGDLVIAGAETSLKLPFNFRAVSEAKGNLNINVVDELFFFAEGSPRLQNATVTLLDPFTGTVIFSEQDADGILAKTDLVEGYYTLRISADSHDIYEQNIHIGAGETEDVQAFLSRQTVKYTWTVTPTEIEDQYTISIESKFETDVPIPTVVIEPNLIDLANLQTIGQVMQIDMKVTNYGLIAANDVALILGEHPFYKLEPLVGSIDVLAAKSSVTIPLKITRIADFDTFNTSSNSDSGLSPLSTTIEIPCYYSLAIDYYYWCSGVKIKRAIPIPVLNPEGTCFAEINDPPSNTTDNTVDNTVNGQGLRNLFYSTSYGYGGIGITPLPHGILSLNANCNPFWANLGEALVNAGIKAGGYFPPTKPLSAALSFWKNAANAFDPNSPDRDNGFGLLGQGSGYLADKLSDKKYNPSDYTKAAGKLATRLGIAGDLYDTYADFNERFGSSSTQSISLISNSSTSIDQRIEDFRNSLEKATLAYQFWQTFFGDDVWLKSAKTDEFSTWFGSFLDNADIGEIEVNGTGISEVERNSLLELPLPSPLTGSDVNKFIDRWNQTIDYWNIGIFNTSDVPDGQSLNFLALDQILPLQIPLEEADNQAQAEGYIDIIDAALKKAQELEEVLNNDGGVCAKVRIKIDQEAIMTRAAFLGSLEIENGNITNLEKLSVTLQVKDAQGKVVNDLFGITDPILNNITSVDGTGILTGDDPATSVNEGIGSAKWTFIPTNLAAPEIPTQYSIGGTLSYVENGTTVTVPLLSTPITVYPQAELYLDYFHQRDVFADDPFTDDIVETSVPYSLAVLVRNEGKGDAKNLKITSGQPKIIDNEKGLLVDFQIIGSEVNGTGVSPSLTVNFGNIAAGKTGVADWLLKSSLQGKFVDYKATFEHVNSLGKAELSLIKEVKIHELIHTVQVNHPNPDNLPDFLVNDTFDAQFTPDTLYFSSGGTAPVKAVKDATIDAPATINDLSVQISATVENGWTYLRLAEPSNSQFDIVKIQRADNTEINLKNIWTTDRTFPGTGRPIYENILHFLDNTTAGNTTYTVTYIAGGPTVTDIIDVSPDPRATAINAISVDFSEAIKTNTFDYNDLSLTVNGGSNLINATVAIVPLSPTRYQITGLNSLTATDGEYTLAVNASGIEDTTGKLGTGSLTETWIKAATGNSDTTPPIVTDIIDLLIDPRNQPVSNLNVSFSEKIDLSTFNWQDITLTQNGGTNLINNTVTISATNDTTYRINGLSGLTTTDGNYTLTVNGSGIQDLSGNAGTGTQSETWVMDTTAPAAPSNVIVAGISSNNLNNVETLYTTSLQNTTSLQVLTTSGQTLINTTTPTISGELGETGLKVFFYDKNTNQLLTQATVTETQFSISVELPSPGARELEIRVQDAAGNTTNTTLSLFADVAPPVISQFLNVPTSTPNPVNTIDVQFSEQINLNTFDQSDLTLSRDGVNLTLPNTVTVTYLSDTTYRINGLDSLTNTPGVYSLKVDATTIQDNTGNSGDAAK